MQKWHGFRISYTFCHKLSNKNGICNVERVIPFSFSNGLSAQQILPEYLQILEPTVSSKSRDLQVRKKNQFTESILEE